MPAEPDHSLASATREAADARAAVSASIDRVAAALDDKAIQRALGGRIIRRYRQDLDDVLGRLQEACRIVVIGDFKRGKSSLINALVGEHVCAAGVAQETIAITEVRYGAAMKAEIVLFGDERVALAPDELSRAKLEPIWRRFGERAERVVVTLPLPALRGMVWIDTPGTGDLFNSYDDAVASELRRADFLVYCVSARSPLAASESNFLKVAVGPHDFPKVVFAITMIDTVPSEGDVKRLRDRIQRKIEDTFPGAEVFHVSTSSEVPVPTNQLIQLRERVEATISEYGEQIQIDRQATQTIGTYDELRATVAALDTQLACKLEQVREALASEEQTEARLLEHAKAVRDQLSERFMDLADETTRWMKAFIDRLENDVAQSLANVSIEEVNRHLPLFLIDSLKHAMELCLDVHLQIITETIGKASEGVAGGVALAINADNSKQLLSATTLAFSKWRKEHAITFGSDVVWLGLLVKTAAQISNALRDNAKMRGYGQAFRSTLTTLREQLPGVIGKRYHKLADVAANDIAQHLRAVLAQRIASLRQADALQSADAEAGIQARTALTKLALLVETERKAIFAVREACGLAANAPTAIAC